MWIPNNQEGRSGMLYVCFYVYVRFCHYVYPHGLHACRPLYIRQLADTYSQRLALSEQIRLQELIQTTYWTVFVTGEKNSPYKMLTVLKIINLCVCWMHSKSYFVKQFAFSVPNFPHPGEISPCQLMIFYIFQHAFQQLLEKGHKLVAFSWRLNV